MQIRSFQLNLRRTSRNQKFQTLKVDSGFSLPGRKGQIKCLGCSRDHGSIETTKNKQLKIFLAFKLSVLGFLIKAKLSLLYRSFTTQPAFSRQLESANLFMQPLELVPSTWFSLLSL